MRIVLRLHRGKRPLNPFLAVSLALHLAVLSALFLAPFFKHSRPPLDDAVVVALAGALPGLPAASAPAAAPAPAPPPRAAPAPEPKGPSLAPAVPATPKVKKEKKEERKKEEPEREAKPEPQPSPSGGSGPGNEAAPAGPGAAGTGVTSLDVGDASTGWYGEAVRAALQSAWVRPVLEDASEIYSVVVRFEIGRDGAARNAEIETPSGVPSLDRSALRAVNEASPFPPPPASWKAPTLTARIRFDLKPDAN